MLEEPVITTQNLGKRFRLGEVQAYKTLRDSLMQGLHGLRHGEFRRRRDVLWALRGISIEIRRGEAVGLIGGNGAGKSTLLKILSRITEPTEGTGLVRGRVGSLLEVGTGFHAELTGRENIFLNGAILGMPRADIRRKFDAIVAFAEVERFIDTPVKHYSSGMYMRLAFAVAAHLEPDILMVDEVLAVGDVSFQKKCLGRMNEVAVAGRTVLFVSHNMAQMRRLCSRIIWLRDGGVHLDGEADAVISAYLAAAADAGMALRRFPADALPGDGSVGLREVQVRRPGGEVNAMFNMNEPLGIECELDVQAPVENLHVMFSVYSIDGVLVFSSASWDHFGLEPPLARSPGRWRYATRIDPFFLNRGIFSVSVNIQVPGVRTICNVERTVTFEISEIGGAGGAKSSARGGVVRPKLTWDCGMEDHA